MTGMTITHNKTPKEGLCSSANTGSEKGARKQSTEKSTSTAAASADHPS
jgi:hypothetical protein